MEIVFKKVVGLINYYSLVNCYAHFTGQYSVLIFRIPTVLDIIPLELVHFRNSQYPVSSCSFSCPPLPLLLFVFVFKCRSRKRLRDFPTVFIPGCRRERAHASPLPSVNRPWQVDLKLHLSSPLTRRWNYSGQPSFCTRWAKLAKPFVPSLPFACYGIVLSSHQQCSINETFTSSHHHRCITAIICLFSRGNGPNGTSCEDGVRCNAMWSS